MITRFLAELHAATEQIIEPRVFMATTARLLAEELGVDRCAYAEVIDERVFDITGDHAIGVPSIVGRWDVAGFGPGCVEDMRANRPFVVTDVETDPRIEATHLPAYRATTIRAVICVPLHKAGAFTAAMAVHQTRPRVWTAEEIALVTAVGARCWEALARHKVVRDLRASEARYRAIVEASPECVKVVDKHGIVQQINAAGVSLLGARDAAQVIGTCVFDAIAPEHRDAFRELTERVCRGGAGELQVDLVTPNGRRTVELRAVALPAESGGFVALVIARDITERAASERALAQSRARLDYAVRLSGVGFWYCDLPFDELQWDPNVRGHFFIAPDERVTLELFYARMHPDDREVTRHAIEGSIANHASYDVVYRTVDPASGATKFIRAVGGTAYAPDGTPAQFDGVTFDVTALRDADRKKDEFIATLAHELRNPLAPIRTGLEVLGQPDVTAEAAAHTRGVMMRQLDHLVRLVDDLLDISRITRGRVTLVRSRVELRAILDSALETTRMLLDACGHRLVIDVPASAVLDADPIRLTQVFANLLNNAAKYTPPGGTITIAARPAGGMLDVRVSDTGVGIPSEMLESVFDTFTQVGRTVEHAQGGLGIGLTLVRQLVTMHGGTIVAESAGVGRGTTFVIRLPLAVATSAEAPVASSPAPAAHTELDILIVDDNVDAAEMLGELLEIRGHRTRVVHLGQAAVDAIASHPADVIFLDIGLPDISGFEVARAIRALPALARRPWIVALTGWGAAKDRQMAQDAGFDLHVTKPMDLSKLGEILGSVPGQ